MTWVILIFCLAAVFFLGDDSRLLPFLIVFPIVLIVWQGIRRKREIFSPEIFFSSYYLLWMGIGYAVSFYRRSAGHHPNYSYLASLILLAYLSWLVGCHFPRFKVGLFSGRSKTLEGAPPEGPGYNRTMQVCLTIIILGLVGGVIFYLGGAINVLLGGVIEESRVSMIFGRGYLFFLVKSINTAVPIYIAAKWYFGKKLDIWDYCLVLLAITLISLTFSRRPILWFVITLVILFHYLKKRLTYRRALIWAGALLLAAVVIIQLRSPGRAFGVRFLHEINVHVENIALYLRNLKKIGGQGLAPFVMNLKMLLPGHQIDFGLWLKNKLGLTFLGGGISVPLIGEGMLSFRTSGVILEAFLIGYILKLSYHKLKGRFSLRNLLIYTILLIKAVEAINYGLALLLISALYEIALVIIIVPPYLFRERTGPEGVREPR